MTEDELSLTDVRGIGPATAVKLHGAGIQSVQQLANAEVEHLISVVGNATSKKIVKNARELIEEEGKTELLEETTPKEEIQEAIETEPEEDAPTEEAEGPGDLTEVDGIGPSTKEDLEAAGYVSPADLAGASIDDLTSIQGVGRATADKFISNAKDVVGEISPVSEEPTETPPEEELEEFEEEEIEEFEEEEEEEEEVGVIDEEDIAEPETTGEVRRERHESSPTPQGIPTKKKKGVQIGSTGAEKLDLDDLRTEETSTGWEVKAKELTEEEREARRQRQKEMQEANRITREIPTAPKPVEGKKDKDGPKGEKPVKKKKKKKKKDTQQVQAQKQRIKQEEKEYYSNKDIHSREIYARPRGSKSEQIESGSSEPRKELDRDTYLGRITSHRRSRRTKHHKQVIVNLQDQYDPDQLVGKKVYFEYPDGDKISGQISKRFGKKSSGKVLVNFKKGIREEGIFQELYVY